jgi:hypothetical protein
MEEANHKFKRDQTTRFILTLEDKKNSLKTFCHSQYSIEEQKRILNPNMANTTTFRRLPDLPPEIRIMIFKYALPAPGPKIAVWTTMFPESKHPKFVSRWEIMNGAAWDIIPALLMTNSEARDVAFSI